MVLDLISNDEDENDPEAQHWISVDGAYWRRPEGPNSSYKVNDINAYTHTHTHITVHN